MAEHGLTPLGELLERARGEMSKREAARRAGISEARWRQVVTGRQRASGVDVPVNPRRSTVIAMARAVGADAAAALRAAGYDAAGVEASPAGDPYDAAVRDIEQSALPDRDKRILIAQINAMRPDPAPINDRSRLIG